MMRASGIQRSDRNVCQLVRHFPGGFDQVRHQALGDLEVAFVLASIPDIVTLGQNAPDFRAQTERLREHLKHDVAMAGAIASGAERCQAKRVSRVVGQVK